ncbi:MAG: Zn-ribbon domain-containing OB-fold protein [Desulfobacterales bacterium]|nr:Zn-ribbon domain-containing OB-fold protein [Desulfobacterales bacterium]
MKENIIIESGALFQPFNYSIGLYGSKFFKELTDNRKFFGTKCQKCNKVYIPPRKVCGPCFSEMTEFVEVGPKGVIGTYTILRYAFIDPETGEQKPVPYGYGFIKLDGADTLFQHYINIEDESKVKIGARVEPVFSEEKKGTIKDILYFKIID